MADLGSAKATGIGIAGGSVAVALIETLLDKNILTLTEARSVLERAMTTAGMHFKTPEGFEASKIIGEMMKGRFSAR